MGSARSFSYSEEETAEAARTLPVINDTHLAFFGERVKSHFCPARRLHSSDAASLCPINRRTSALRPARCSNVDRTPLMTVVANAVTFGTDD
ncbi:hypothetical protein EVAR_28853_1 [Eumeta japonica]|uniref:Uncharacterized protein n=1 Tax=Eumeta variegata TaxID=151549 RepID=A0A4C1YGZ2_EUMVA|nr:hypothetical protein EVAR_28853_1 [Eumeta japonica]